MPRQGWISAGVPLSEVESVADHSFFVAFITLILCLEEKSKGNNINLERAIIMALIHDLPESVSQDIDRRIKQFTANSYDQFKRELDENALKELLSMFPSSYSEQLLNYFEEFQKQETIEAKIVFEADRLEPLLQIITYENLGLPKSLFKVIFEHISREKDNYQIKLVKDLVAKLLEE